MQALLLVAEQDGPPMFARIGIMRALNRGYVREFNTSRKDTHWQRKFETRPVMTTLKIGFALVGLSAAFSSTAFAENCRAFPRGPEKRACVMREHPGMFEAREAKKERCKQLARERGDTHRTATGAGGMRDFVRDCVHGKQS